MTALLILTALCALFLILDRTIFASLTSSVRYGLDRLFLILLALPFFPALSLGQPAAVGFPSVVSTGAVVSSVMDMAQEALPLAHAPQILPSWIGYLYWAGAALTALFYGLAYFHLLRQKRRSHLPCSTQEQEIKTLLQQEQKALGLRRVFLLFSDEINSPLSFGILFPTVLLPTSILNHPTLQTALVLRHELTHLKQKDALWNFLFALGSILYWFHPLVQLCFAQARFHRELACDEKVLLGLNGDMRRTYGRALLAWACGNALSACPAFSGASKRLRQRIEAITAFPPQVHPRRQWLCILLCCLMVAMAAPSVTNAAGRAFSALQPLPNYTQLDVASAFGSFSGSAVLLRPDGSYAIYGPSDAQTPAPPYSTYKIPSALIALEEGQIAPNASLLAWDGTSYPFASWQKDQTLQSALQNSVNWYFESLNASLGPDCLASYFSAFSYGNGAASSALDQFWADGTLTVSPLQQVDFLHRLCQNDLPASIENQQALQDALFLHSSPYGALYGKTGTGNWEGQDREGWFVGWIATDSGPACFSIHIKGVGANGQTAYQIAQTLFFSATGQ